MQTNLTPYFLNTEKGRQANSILRSCVHCGFCTATCPTYQLTNDELDGPRGRIYLIKQILEGKPVTEKTQLHLDRCLTCRSCETTCPSGVKYGNLIDIGREIVEQKLKRKPVDVFIRYALRKIIPNPSLFKSLLSIGQFFKPYLPKYITEKIPQSANCQIWPNEQSKRKMLVLSGCVQQTASPQTNVSAARVLNKLGIQLIEEKQVKCCGAVSHHLSATQEAINTIKKNIDNWWPHVNNGIEAIVITASGCGVMIKDYAHLLEKDEMYKHKAKRISLLAKDISEVLLSENYESFKTNRKLKVAFHNPCTLQHGLKIDGVVEKIMSQIGYDICHVEDSHLCCGSAGTYSILQEDFSKKLLHNKMNALNKNQPDIIVSANIGCQMHLNSKAKSPVKHWIDLVNDSI